MTGSTERRFDVVVLGTGTAGQVVAKACRDGGRSVAIVDERPFGGTCENRGCDPKKVLVQAAELFDHARRMQGRGVGSMPAHDWAALMKFKRSFTDPVPARTERHLVDAGVEAFHGHARFVDETAVAAADVVLRGESVVVATGAVPMGLGFDGAEHAVTSDDFLELAELPRSLVFIGGGYVSFELAHVAARFGADVHILHRGERPLEHFDADLVARLVRAGEEVGVHVHLRSPVERIERAGAASYRVHAAGKTYEGGLVVHGAGRVPNVAGLDLERAHVATAKNGGVLVDEHLRSTTNPRVYAAGDVAATGHPALTPVSSAHARVVAENLLHGARRKVDLTEIPTVVFAIPALAAVGLTEREAKERGLSVRVHTEDASSWYSTRSLGAAHAMTKVLVDEAGKVVGAHLLGPHAADLVNVFALAMRAGLTRDTLRATTFAYPTAASDVSYVT